MEKERNRKNLRLTHFVCPHLYQAHTQQTVKSNETSNAIHGFTCLLWDYLLCYADQMVHEHCV